MYRTEVLPHWHQAQSLGPVRPAHPQGLVELLSSGHFMSATRFRLFPRTRTERIGLLWALIGAGNFLAFLAHILYDGTSAFPTGGRFAGGQYFVPSHGKEIPFSEAGYFLSYAHGILFVTLHIACMVVLWRLHERNKHASRTA